MKWDSLRRLLRTLLKDRPLILRYVDAINEHTSPFLCSNNHQTGELRGFQSSSNIKVKLMNTINSRTLIRHSQTQSALFWASICLTAGALGLLGSTTFAQSDHSDPHCAKIGGP